MTAKMMLPGQNRVVISMALACLTALCGCSSGDHSTYADLRVLWGQVFDSEPQGVSLQEAAAIPFATIGVRIGGGPEAILLLATEQPGQQIWTSAQRIVITTEDGRIVRTVGLPANLSGLMAGNSAFNVSAAGGNRDFQADFRDLQRYGVVISCSDAPGEAEAITILGQPIQTLRVEEDCRAPSLRWSFHNTFWMDSRSGFVWRSIQSIAPKMEPLELEVLRPPG